MSNDEIFEREAEDLWILIRDLLPESFRVREIVDAICLGDPTFSRREAKNIVFDYIGYWGSEREYLRRVDSRPARWAVA